MVPANCREVAGLLHPVRNVFERGCSDTEAQGPFTQAFCVDEPDH